ncbi:MAG TPA: MFS transporter [Solirubrobacteraceae bacterium]|jgi:EmrB/QacA subfamily drug resistance transporter|nr:MFS transporter [Solirubrobacteraceae bacterium]
MPVAHPRRWLILFVILAAECMDLLDGTIVNVAAPTIHHDLRTSSTALQWIIGGYPLAIAVGLITGGRLGDLFGRRRLFVIGAAGFTLASVLCGLAPSTGALIGARLLQGVAGALMLPQGLGIIREVFPGDELPKAFGVFGPVMGSAALLGPIVGGGLIGLDLFGSGWRMVFFINLPLGIAAVIGAVRLVPESRSDKAAKLDIGGVGLVSAAAVLLVYPLIQGRELGWPVWTYVSMAASVAAFGLFWLHLARRVRTGGDPLVIPSVFTHRGYSGGLLVLTLFFVGMIGSSLALTLFLQIGQGYSAIHAGLTFIPLSLGVAVAAPLSGGLLMPRVGGRLPIQAGGVVSLAGYGAVIAAVHGAGHVSSWDVLPGLLVIGLGMGLFIAPLFDTILAAVTDAETGSASGVLNALQQLAGAIGVAVLGTVFFTAVSHGGFGSGLERTLWWQLGLTTAMLAASTLLPKWARDPADALAGAAGTDAQVAGESTRVPELAA